MNILNNPVIRQALVKRWDEMELRNIEIIRDAGERGIKITEGRMSKYRSSDPNSLSPIAILFLLTRYCIYFNWNLGKPSIVGDKVRYFIPMYNEAEGLEVLKKVFPDLHETTYKFGLKKEMKPKKVKKNKNEQKK